MPDADDIAAVSARLDAAGGPHRNENGGVAFDDLWRNRIVLTTGATSRGAVRLG